MGLSWFRVNATRPVLSASAYGRPSWRSRGAETIRLNMAVRNELSWFGRLRYPETARGFFLFIEYPCESLRLRFKTEASIYFGGGDARIFATVERLAHMR